MNAFFQAASKKVQVDSFIKRPAASALVKTYTENSAGIKNAAKSGFGLFSEQEFFGKSRRENMLSNLNNPLVKPVGISI